MRMVYSFRIAIVYANRVQVTNSGRTCLMFETCTLCLAPQRSKMGAPRPRMPPLLPRRRLRQCQAVLAHQNGMLCRGGNPQPPGATP